jgi:hypothetical protein
VYAFLDMMFGLIAAPVAGGLAVVGVSAYSKIGGPSGPLRASCGILISTQAHELIEGRHWWSRRLANGHLSRCRGSPTSDDLSGDKKSDPVVELVIHGWKMTNEVTDTGHSKLLNPSLIHLRFEGVSNLDVNGLNHQNVINRLVVTATSNDLQAPLHVELEHCYGLSGKFSARRAKVLSVIRQPTTVR